MLGVVVVGRRAEKGPFLGVPPPLSSRRRGVVAREAMMVSSEYTPFSSFWGRHKFQMLILRRQFQVSNFFEIFLGIKGVASDRSLLGCRWTKQQRIHKSKKNKDAELLFEDCFLFHRKYFAWRTSPQCVHLRFLQLQAKRREVCISRFEGNIAGPPAD